MEICKTRNIPLLPQSEGMVERYLKTLKEHPRYLVLTHPEIGTRGYLFSYGPREHLATRTHGLCSPARCSGQTYACPAIHCLGALPDLEQRRTEFVKDPVERLNQTHHYARQI
jgi:hypothetical protein